MNIKDFEYNQKIQGYYMIKKIEERTSKNGGSYIDINVADQNKDEVNGKVWNTQGIDLNTYKSGILVKVRGQVQKFNNKMQLHIEKIRLVDQSDDVNFEDYIAAAPVSSNQMIREIYSFIDKITHPQIKELTLTLFRDKEDKLSYYPAAKTHHHNIKGGLLYHIRTMLDLGEKISSAYDFINTDLLYAGIVLHDLSKTEEMIADELGIVEDYSTEGKLLGHIIQGITEIDRVCRELFIDDEIKMVLQHMILSHHYHAEYGSPKMPLVPEAELLHYIDLIDARMYGMNKALSNIEGGTFSEKNYSLEGRSLYKTSFDERNNG
ncbi:3'-5' exoribonuclease YhaM family protein [Alkalibaculum bacchi]|uniref:3'-5' exoribonuclease YhaM family protein n=1 Tax=Alkalibaculum bacchi TaxID=645887 RepID=UPI0026EA0DDB|nr:HD domain-containing protein [Alkalibaculum bacchi]